MSGQIRKDDIIHADEINKAIQSVANEIESLVKVMNSVVNNSITANSIIKTANSTKELGKQYDNTAKNAEKYTIAEKEIIKVEKQIDQLYARLNDRYQEENRYKQELLIKNQKINKQLREEITGDKAAAQAKREKNLQMKNQQALTKLLIVARNTEAGSLSRLNALNNIYKQRMSQLNVLIPEQAKTYDFLNKKILMNQQAMAKMAMGAQKGGRQFNMLQWQIMQVSRELPAFAYGINVGIGALSNNLPMLADEISNVRKANKLLAAEGKATVPVFKQIAKSIFSWQTALIVVVTLVTLYGREIAEWTKRMINSKKELDNLYNSQKLFNNITNEAIKSTQKERFELTILSETVSDVSKSEDERYSALNKIRDIMPDILKGYSDEEILAGKAEDAIREYSETIFKRAEAEGIVAKASELYNKKYELLLERRNSFTKEKTEELINSMETILPGGLIMDWSKLITPFANTSDKIDEEIAKIDESITNLKGLIDIRNLFEDKLTDDETTDNNKGKIKSPLEVMREEQEIELEKIRIQQREFLAINELTGQDLINQEAINTDKLLQLQIKHARERLKLTKKGSIEEKQILNEIFDLQVSGAENVNEYREKTSKETLRRQKENDEQLISDLYARINEERVVMAEAATEQLKSAQNNNDKKIEINKKLLLTQLQFERERLQELIKSGQLSVEAEAEISDRILEIKEAEEKTKRDLAEETRRKQEENLRYIGQAVSNGAALYNQILENQLARSKEVYEADLAAAGDSAERKYLAEKKYQEEQAKLKRRQAIADKAQALFNIGLELAMAGAKVNPFQIAAATLAMATVLATPIPEFEKGTKDAPETFIAGEKGKEAIIKPSGEVVLTPDKPTLFSDKSFIGSTILPHDETQRWLANYAVNQIYDIVDMGDTNNLLSKIAKNTGSSKVEYFSQNGKMYRKNGYVTSLIR